MYEARCALPWRQNPTDRQKVVSKRLAEKVMEETGVVVDPDVARAVRWTALRWSERTMFLSPDELEFLMAIAKFDRKRAHAMLLLQKARQELDARFDSTDDDDDDDDD